MPDLPPPLSKWKWWERPLTSYEYVRGLKPELTMPPWDVIGCLDIWANVYMKHDPELKEKRDEFLLHWNYVRQRMRGSNLLLRLFEGEAVRRTPCPKHITASHYEKPDCDCNGIGWLPDPSDQLTLFDLGRKRKWL